MTPIQKFAADLKARKGIATRPARNDTPAPAPPCGGSGTGTGSRLERLKQELARANERIRTLEAELKAVGRVRKAKGEIWRLNQALAKIRKGKKGSVARKRIDELEAENEELRNHLKGQGTE